MQVLYPRCAGLDVHKDTVVACVRVMEGGEIKLAGMAGDFYRQRVGQHLEIGLGALEKLKAQERERLHSRKLRCFSEVAFQ